MPIEAANYISDLNVANPSGSDQVAEMDNHIRLLKTVLKTTFPNITGPVVGTQSDLNGTVPIGGVIMWSGALNAIPTGWVLCAGQTGLTRSDAGGTINAPDLRGKFVFGSGDPTNGFLAPLSAGGASTHSHSGTVSGTAISINQMPSHQHGVSDPGHSHGVSDPGHQHSYGAAQSGPGVAGGVSALSFAGNVTVPTTLAYTGISIGGAATNIGIGFTGGGLPHDHGLTVNAANSLPPYLTLAFIMRL